MPPGKTPSSRRRLGDQSGRLLAFADYFDRSLAKPFKWTYTSRPLDL
jgi:hypothetical protein